MDFQAQYLAAVKRDQDVRDAAFLNTNICGVDIRQMTPLDYVILDGLGLLLLYSSKLDYLLSLLWLISPNYKPGKFRAWLFGWQHRKMDFETAKKAVQRYIEDTFQDALGASASSEPDYASFAGYLAFAMGKHLGWDWQLTINTPLKVIFTMLKCIRKDIDSKWDSRSRRVKKVEGDRLRLVNERNNARRQLLNVLHRRANQN